MNVEEEIQRIKSVLTKMINRVQFRKVNDKIGINMQGLELLIDLDRDADGYPVKLGDIEIPPTMKKTLEFLDTWKRKTKNQIEKEATTDAYIIPSEEIETIKIEHVLSDIEDFINSNKFKEKEESAYWKIKDGENNERRENCRIN